MTPAGNVSSRSRRAGEPLYQQLYENLRESILSGQLPGGAQLPASRVLATDFGVSRNTVLAAFERLHAEGYVEGRRGSGTFVARILPERMYSANAPAALSSQATTPVRGLSQRGEAIRSSVRMPLPASTGTPGRSTAFQIGLPSFDGFPGETWSRLHAARLRHSARELMAYGDPAGYRPLREAIAEHVATTRGVRCTADQIVVVSGSQQALEFCARMLLDPGDPAWLEDPGYLGARAALTSAGAKIIPVPVDAAGMNVGTGIRREPTARLAIVTPSYQFPLGVTMSLQRRLALIEWATESGAWIVEDDYDSEFRYVGRPLAALHAIDRHNRVIYVGTFSKVLFPGLRMGYVVAPPTLVDGLVAAHLSTDVHSPTIDQAVLADFMAGGGFSKHLRRMRVRYHHRQRFLVAEASRLRGRLRVDPADGGLHLLGHITDGDDGTVAARAASAGVHVWPLSIHCVEAEHPPAVLLGYACAGERSIRHGVDVLDRILRRG